MDNVTDVFSKIHEQQRLNIARSFGMIEKAKDVDENPQREEIIKALSSDNPFERMHGESLLEKSDLSDIEKSDIMEAINYGSSTSTNFLIKKTGREIKNQIQNVILPDKQAKLATMKAEADRLLGCCGTAPTKDVCPWWCNDIPMDCGYKIYHWEELRMPCNDNNYVCDTLNWEKKTTPNVPTTEEECKSRNDYNETVEKICRILVDVKACEILQKNLTDDATIELTPRQILVFQFD